VFDGLGSELERKAGGSSGSRLLDDAGITEVAITVAVVADAAIADTVCH
jgi:hypothetical protein